MVSPFNKRNKFDLTNEHKLTCDMGKLVPIYCQDVLPGDTFRVNTDMIIRLQALIAPIYHRVNVFTHFFFIPNRIVFDQWEDFITGGVEGNSTVVRPTITVTPTVGSLADYFGLPIGKPCMVSALPFRAYAKVYNDWYRNETLQAEVPLSVAAGPDTTTNTTLLNRNWQRDYFTSALPWTQRGAAVRVPLGTSAQVAIAGNGDPIKMTVANPETGVSGNLIQITDSGLQTQHRLMTIGSNLTNTGDVYFNTGWGNAGLRGLADLSQASSATINDWRVAFQIQRLLEKNARGGARYVEWLLSHFGVRSSDARLQRPEYLGGGRAGLNINEIVQTSATDETSPQGNMAGHSYTGYRSHSFTKSFEEHGYIIGILSILPRSNYQQGIERHWLYESRYDYPLPVLSHLGEQGIYNKELYLNGDADDDKIFGYAPRYEECRHKYSQVHGDFRNSLNFWHMGRIFANRPKLNAQFVVADPTKRIFATEELGQHVLIDLVNNVKAIRALPKHGIPGFIDHD
jgi:hypothetical protein